jgi:hypothetical protein
MAEAIRNFSDTPNVAKFPKRALQGNLGEIALGSMNDLTGIVASLLGKARAQRAENIVLEIPPGGEQQEPVEMRVIDFLSQELQIAVDSLKSAYPNNEAGLEEVSKFLRDRNAQAAVWIRDLKDPQTYLTRPVAVEPGATDTVSRILQIVNSNWNAPSLEVDSNPRSYQNVLFGKEQIPFSQYQEQVAYETRNEYRAAMAQAIARKEQTGDDTAIKAVAMATKESKEGILALVDPATGEGYSPQSWVSAYWHVAHDANTGDAGLVFMMFGTEIVNRLRDYDPEEVKVFDVYGTQFNEWAHPTWRWRGQTVQTRVEIAQVAGRQQKVIYMKWNGATRLTGWHLLGIISDAQAGNLVPGQVSTRLAYTVRFKAEHGTTRMRFLDPSLEDDYMLYL